MATTERASSKWTTGTAAARAADHSGISFATVGGDYIRAARVGAGKADGLFWLAGQRGQWGSQQHAAFAFDTEAGYQFDKTWAKPWFRGGYAYFSGDGSSANNQHGTFIPLLPTSRAYARFPFYSEVNLQDFFAQLILQPSKRMTVRADIHGLKLADNHDLWYSGGGAYDNSTFGYAGKPSNGHSNLGVLYDVSLDYQVGKQVSLYLYGGYSDGGDVQKAIYKSGSAVFVYTEAAVPILREEFEPQRTQRDTEKIQGIYPQKTQKTQIKIQKDTENLYRRFSLLRFLRTLRINPLNFLPFSVSLCVLCGEKRKG